MPYKMFTLTPELRLPNMMSEIRIRPAEMRDLEKSETEALPIFEEVQRETKQDPRYNALLTRMGINMAD